MNLEANNFSSEIQIRKTQTFLVPYNYVNSPWVLSGKSFETHDLSLSVVNRPDITKKELAWLLGLIQLGKMSEKAQMS